jgi:hypothetical protein
MLAVATCVQLLQTTFRTPMLRHSVFVWYATSPKARTHLNQLFSILIPACMYTLFSDVSKKPKELVQNLNCNIFGTYYIDSRDLNRTSPCKDYLARVLPGTVVNAKVRKCHPSGPKCDEILASPSEAPRFWRNGKQWTMHVRALRGRCDECRKNEGRVGPISCVDAHGGVYDCAAHSAILPCTLLACTLRTIAQIKAPSLI